MLALPGLVGFAALLNVIAVYQAPSARTAWSRSKPLAVGGTLAVLLLSNWISESLWS
ncbi:hypothetical protein FHX42_001210 [Saccharopolyspora lacisalsi]|uniref:Uncharacterized protein n=1 Tax=Halosaccharopolyspora lacisalsi TaxID=1000566 RepID=A0A839DXD6_9PSEU|nr:hypothetical protein [Halosaccharopolyspora lacisalsi]